MVKEKNECSCGNSSCEEKSSRSMSETHTSTEAHDESGIYEIRIKGHIEARWADWFGGLSITLEEDGDTLLTGPVVDQAALYGVLRKVRDVGMPLVSVIRVEPDSSTSLGTDPSTALRTGQEDVSDVEQ
jgi:hypothetical protein